QEVYRELDGDLQVDLGLLAVAPTLDRELAALLVGGGDRAERSIATALSIGILEERANGLDFHPLARAFVDARPHPDALAPRERGVDACLEVYLARRDWDSAFEVIARFGREGDLDALVHAALDPLFQSGRLATVETWLRHASARGESSAYLTIAASELNMRRGQLSISETL